MNPTPILGIIAGALSQSAAETPVPLGPKIRQRKPWQRASDDRRKLRRGWVAPGSYDPSPKRVARRKLEAEYREHTGRELSPRQYVKLRKALARAAREEARARQAAALGPETVADGED